MKIMHIAPNAIYDDYWGFQDNLLPKYHKKMGHDVYLLVSTRIHPKDGRSETEQGEYDLKDGTHVIRLPLKEYPVPMMKQLRSRLDAYPVLERIQPDFIFFHGLCSSTMSDCIRYKKQIRKQGRKCVIVQDNHLDYNIGSASKTLRQKLARCYYRIYNGYAQRYVEKVYGVTPWRKQYAEDYYRISPDKTDVLIMGADDEHIRMDHRSEIRSRIRSENQIGEDAFLIVTGGKIDKKKMIHLLMEAAANRQGVELLIFGSLAEDIKERFEELLHNSSNIRYIGWIASEAVYDYFLAADLVVFPGQHSVLWEQACACKVPCIFRRWPGMEHVDHGGNADFLDEVTVETLDDMITGLYFTGKYAQMKAAAESEATDIYLYSRIAAKALECAEFD